MIDTLYICDSTYQIITACCVQYQFDYNAAIILTDYLDGMQSVSDRISEYSSLFDKSYFVEAKKYLSSQQYTNENIDYEIIEFLERNELNNVNRIMIGSLDVFAKRLFKIFKNNYKKYSICGGFIEEGTATYNYYTELISGYKYKEDFKDIYLFEPSLLSKKTDMEIIKIDNTIFNKKKYIHELNLIFDYYQLQDVYKEKFIVLASSYVEIDVFKNVDDIVEALIDAVGIENIFVKNHPRVHDDYYYNKGIKTNVNMSVPWEIIAMNMDLSKKVIISAYSGSLFTPKVLFGKEMRGVALMDIVDQKDPFMLSNYIKDYVVRRYPESFVVPNNIEEFKSILKQMK